MEHKVKGISEAQKEAGQGAVGGILSGGTGGEKAGKGGN